MVVLGQGNIFILVSDLDIAYMYDVAIFEALFGIFLHVGG